jgi:hypothetical protein
MYIRKVEVSDFLRNNYKNSNKTRRKSHPNQSGITSKPTCLVTYIKLITFPKPLLLPSSSARYTVELSEIITLSRFTASSSQLNKLRARDLVISIRGNEEGVY